MLLFWCMDISIFVGVSTSRMQFYDWFFVCYYFGGIFLSPLCQSFCSFSQVLHCGATLYFSFLSPMRDSFWTWRSKSTQRCFSNGIFIKVFSCRALVANGPFFLHGRVRMILAVSTCLFTQGHSYDKSKYFCAELAHTCLGQPLCFFELS